MKVVVFGLSITSSWGNGHASTFRSLLAAVARRGHQVLFLERDVPWYARHRDLPTPGYLRVALYRSLDDLPAWSSHVEAADLVIVGSYVAEAPAVIDWVRERVTGVLAFYDIDTPVTLAALAEGDSEYLRRDQVPAFGLYLSFSGGPVLDRLSCEFGARRPRALYCSYEPETYAPVDVAERWVLGYLGTYSADRQPGLNERLCEPARRCGHARFAVAGAQFPAGTPWPSNVDRFEHIAPAGHARFFRSQRFTLNLTRQAMVDAGYSPSVRLFEAAACGVPIISDRWPGLETFFVPGEEILLADTARETIELIFGMGEDERRRVAERARRRVVAAHSADQRAVDLETYVREAEPDRADTSRASSVA